MSFGTSQTHDSAPLHVSGRAQYCDDIALPANTLHAAFGLEPRRTRENHVARSRRPSWNQRGVAAIALPADIPGENNYGGAVHDDPDLRGRTGAIRRPAAVRGRGRLDARRAQGRAPGRRSTIDAAARASRHPRRAGRRELSCCPVRRMRRGDPRAQPCTRAAASAPPRRHRRPGSFLPRRTYRGRASRRRTAACWCTARRSTPPKCRSIVAHALEEPAPIASWCNAGAWAADSAARRARPH